jgi:pantoate--beta-alanine ligase
MKQIRSGRALELYLGSLRKKGKHIGFVPTMGALHAGHLALVQQAVKENEVVVVSIFVNPTQFGPKEDFKKYPRVLNKDFKLLRRASVDVVFTPSVSEMYPQGDQTWVEVGAVSEGLCGRFRPGHFKGVATIVAKLFNLVRPDRAYFGQKDFQQLKVIEQIVRDLCFPVRIRPCPTVRDREGLALSSRNAYLRPDQKKRALSIHKTLRVLARYVKQGETRVSWLENLGKKLLRKEVDLIQYLEIRRARDLSKITRISKGEKNVILTAVKIGPVRLIDNQMV